MAAEVILSFSANWPNQKNIVSSGGFSSGGGTRRRMYASFE
jgi:hypothetical protein